VTRDRKETPRNALVKETLELEESRFVRDDRVGEVEAFARFLGYKLPHLQEPRI